MPHLKKYIFTIAVIVIGAAFIWFEPYLIKKEEDQIKKIVPHFYRDQSRSISKIGIKVFYVVPRNKLPYKAWRSLIIPVLEDSIRFHEVQFRGLSVLSYDIFPEPFILEKEAIFYDTGDTNRGNPEGLKNIVPEIEKKATNFLKTEKDEFVVMAIIYEGVGASGAEGAFIISRTFLFDDQYRPFRSSLFYHEFGHTLGLPDRYDTEHNTPFSNDIMGAGRRKPVDLTYIERELLKDVGLIIYD